MFDVGEKNTFLAIYTVTERSEIFLNGFRTSFMRVVAWRVDEF